MAAVGFISGAYLDAAALAPSTSPLQWPRLPVIPAVVVLVALLPAWVAPPARRHDNGAIG